jgi:SPP1 gp7 family putative phage head morphogenesis protein
MTTSTQLLDTAVRHAVHLEGLKTGQAKRFEGFLRKIDKDLRRRLGGEDLTEFSRTRLETLLRQVDGSLKTIYSKFEDEFQSELLDLSQYEAEFEAKALNSIAPENVVFATPSFEQLSAAVRSQPLGVHGANGGKLLTPFIKDWTRTERSRVIGVIRQGFFEGQNTGEILRAIRGTRANQYRDGVLSLLNRNAEAIVRTSVQHVASVARFQTWEQNKEFITGYRWVSTLDGRTSTICRSLDGQVFKVGRGPKPPAHIRCRSTTVAELSSEFDWLTEGRTRASQDGPVYGDQNYYSWLKGQPAAFQDDVLGVTRGKLFRDGGLTAKDFSRLQLDKRFNPLTLEQMREKEPLAFQRAFSGSPTEPLRRLPVDKLDSEAKQYVVSNGRAMGGEFAFAADSATGDVLLAKKGQDSSVSFSAAEQALLRSGSDVTLYHNHPSGSSLSLADLTFSASNGLSRIVAYATKGKGEYIASSFASPTLIKSIHRYADKIARGRIKPLFDAGKLPPTEANHLHWHFVNSALDRQGVIKYESPEISDKTASALKSVGKKRFNEWLKDFD